MNTVIISNRVALIAAAILGALASGYATRSAAEDPGTRSTTVQYGDLDVSNPQGARTLYRRIFTAAAAKNLHLALAELPASFFQNLPTTIRRDKPTVTALRSVLMKPEHAEWLDQIHSILTSVW